MPYISFFSNNFIILHIIFYTHIAQNQSKLCVTSFDDYTSSKASCNSCILYRICVSLPFLGHRSQRLQWPIVITRCPASVVCRPSVVRRPLDYLHFRLLLQNRLMDFDETWYGWSTQGPLQVLLFFGQIRPGADPGRGKNRSRGSPSSGNFFFRPEGYRDKPNA